MPHSQFFKMDTFQIKTNIHHKECLVELKNRLIF